MLQSIKPTVVYHADWGGKAEKRWCARATLGTDGRHTALTAEPVGTPALLIEKSREVAGETGCVFAGFDFPIGVPASFAERAGISSFRTMLPNLGTGEWKNFYSVCDKRDQISAYRPFYPNRNNKGKKKQDLFRGHGVESVEPLLRGCERGGNGHIRSTINNQMAIVSPTSLTDVSRRVLRLQVFTILWMTLEAALSLGTAWSSHSPALLAFGGDSLVELLSAAVVFWRFRFALNEAHAARIGGALLFTLAGLVVLTSVLNLVARNR